jgi:hypothetical protein
MAAKRGAHVAGQAKSDEKGGSGQDGTPVLDPSSVQSWFAGSRARRLADLVRPREQGDLISTRILRGTSGRSGRAASDPQFSRRPLGNDNPPAKGPRLGEGGKVGSRDYGRPGSTATKPADPSKARLAEKGTTDPCPPRPKGDTARAISESLKIGSTAVADAPLDLTIRTSFCKREHQRHTEEAPTVCVPGYRRSLVMARNAQPRRDGSWQQKEEAGAVVDRGKSRVRSACTTRCLSLGFSSRKDAQGSAELTGIRPDQKTTDESSTVSACPHLRRVFPCESDRRWGWRR